MRSPFCLVSLLAALTGAIACGRQEEEVPKAASPEEEKSPSESKVQDQKAPRSKAPKPKAPSQDGSEEVAPNDLPPKDVPRVYAKSRHVWVRSMPTSKVQWIGYLWWGGSVPIRGDTRVPGAGCKKEWVPIEPRGWVCVDDERTTTNPEDPALLAIYPHRPKVDSPWPHKYAAVHAPLRRYLELPDAATQKARELGFERHMEAVLEARKSGSSKNLPEALASLDPSLSGTKPPAAFTLPKGLSEGHNRIVARSAMTYVSEADHGDRAFLLAGDLNWVPKDRVELLKPAQFKGVELGKEWQLPLAFFRGKDRPAYTKNQDDTFTEVPKKFARHSLVQLTNNIIRDGHTKYYQVKGKDLWVSSRQAVIPAPRKKTPWGAKVGQPDTTGKARKGRATWLEASIIGGWLVAFEGTKAVYTTMISAGRGGGPHPGKTALETASTPTGWFPIGGKFKTATMMSSSTPIVHSDVPWTQNFSGPHAIHSAYWHEDWGNLKSAGCVNLAPRDGKWLFEFTEPDVPEGWHGVRYVSRYGGGSTLFIVHQ